MPDADRIKFLEAAEAADSADKSDYSWLYSLDYARLLMNVGQSDKAMTYLDKQLKYDKSSFNANSMKMRLYLAEGKTDEAAQRYNLPVLAKMPLDPTLAELVDAGEIENFQGHWLDGVVDAILKK